MRKSGALFLTRGMICLFFSGFFFFAAAFVSRNLKDQTPAAIEVYDVRGLDVSMAQAEPLSKGEAFAAAGMGELAQAAGVTEELKARDMMQWVGLMNSCKAQAEEILLAELINS